MVVHVLTEGLDCPSSISSSAIAGSPHQLHIHNNNEVCPPEAKRTKKGKSTFDANEVLFLALLGVEEVMKFIGGM